mmetsp:Transcript_19524/g.28918  ORF Transcript_19524/g.28918 Transcript_19524/m.28918 type:complete len:115 (-) Transcript_19524:13-357(-)
MGDVIAKFLITLLVSFWAPWQSFRAIRSTAKDDDTEWLTFWMIYSIFELVEWGLDKAMSSFEYYWEVKLVFIVYLVFFRGSLMIYRILEPMLNKWDKMLHRKILPAEENSAKKY